MYSILAFNKKKMDSFCVTWILHLEQKRETFCQSKILKYYFDFANRSRHYQQISRKYDREKHPNYFYLLLVIAATLPVRFLLCDERFRWSNAVDVRGGRCRSSGDKSLQTIDTRSRFQAFKGYVYSASMAGLIDKENAVAGSNHNAILPNTVLTFFYLSVFDIL